jgi:hypothetical protein
VYVVGKPEGKRPLRRQRYRWVSNINIDGTVIDLTQVKDQ